MSKLTKRLQVIESDPWLEQSEEVVVERYRRYRWRLANIESDSGSIVDFANGYLYFGFQRDDENKGVWFREWLPKAHDVYMFGDFNQWQRYQMPLTRGENGVWSIFFPDKEYANLLTHKSLVKLVVRGENGEKERLPAYIRRAVQNETNKEFAGQVWMPPEQFDWSGDSFDISALENLFIYECHVGMAQEQERVGSYREFEKNVLPRVKALGYNTIQLMAIAEHPYYGSFGYHVSNYFAPSSRFGTPEELKSLIKSAHKEGIAVIMDLVHSHYVKNMAEGLNEMDGSSAHYSPEGDAGYQPYWDSMLFDYGRDEVVHFLLSNAKYWLDEFHFDGFRFDGVTSMIFHHHGYTEFDSREKYFDQNVNNDALTYLTLANKLIHDFRPAAVTIAEDVSGMPAMCSPVEDGGVGFDYRLAMAIPDFWIKTIKELPDQEWNVDEIWRIMTDRLPYVKTITYAESHDQALVGDKTIAFRLMDKLMYDSMGRDKESIVVDRGVALHKMIRLATISLGGEGYLNFMGNEFGHPEWIDFPREGNQWSYKHALRQWSLAKDETLKYSYLDHFDASMISFIKENHILSSGYAYNLLMDSANQTMVYCYGDIVFVLNWHPSTSISNYQIPILNAGRYRVVLSTDSPLFGGQGRVDESVEYFSSAALDNNGKATGHSMKIYNVCRTGVVYRRVEG